MKQFLKCSVLALMALLTMSVFTACGGDDDDTPGGSSEFIGVHRMDVEFNGNFEGLKVETMFEGVKADGRPADLYENGKVLEGNKDKVWASEEVRSFSVQTEDNCGAIVASVLILTDDGLPITSDVSVTMVGYINNKRVATKVFTLPAGKRVLSVVLTTDEGGKGGGVVDDEEIKY